MISIDNAIYIAVNAHKGQVDKSGIPYIAHPIRVMSMFNLEYIQVVAVLHDVVEDTNVSFSDLEEAGLDSIQIEAIDCLTHRKNEKREMYLARIGQNALATAVKIADMQDNMQPHRLAALDEYTRERVTKKYTEGLLKLRQAQEDQWVKYDNEFN